MEEIKKTVDKAITQSIKYDKDIMAMTKELIDTSYKINDQLNLTKSIGFDLPDFCNILTTSSNQNNGKPEFQIGELTQHGIDPNDLNCFGEGEDWKSLLNDQHSIIGAYVNQI